METGTPHGRLQQAGRNGPGVPDPGGAKRAAEFLDEPPEGRGGLNRIGQAWSVALDHPATRSSRRTGSVQSASSIMESLLARARYC
jgi:hypothetical protein